MEQKENNIEKEKTGFSKTLDKKEQLNTEGKKNPQIKLGGKGITDNKKKQRKIKDKYECKKFLLFFLLIFFKFFNFC